MWRALVGLGLICLAAYGAVWLSNHPETVAVTWAGRQYTTSLSVGVVAFVGLAIATALVMALIRFVMSLPSAIGRNSRRRRETQGYTSVSRGLVAIGSGDATAARRYAGEAERLLGSQPLALLLSAQAAQLSGNRQAAETSFRRMTESPDTRVLGLRGLYVEARRRGDEAASRDFAAEASRIAPAVAWASDAVLEAHSADRDWPAATAMIERRTSLGLIDRATSRRQRAVLKTADALERQEHDPEGALATALDALKLAPDLVPAAAMAGRLLSRKGELKRAAKVVETAWSSEPHPDLAAAYLNLRPGDSATDRLRRAETLARLSSWSDESRLAITRAAIEARELKRARDTLRPLVDDRPTVRVCLAMAELEGQDGHSGAAREWLARAARAPRDKAWMADGLVSETWAPVSPVTGRLDAFRWDTPPEVLGAPAIPDDIGSPDRSTRSLPGPEEPDDDPPPRSGPPGPPETQSDAMAVAPQPSPNTTVGAAPAGSATVDGARPTGGSIDHASIAAGSLPQPPVLSRAPLPNQTEPAKASSAAVAGRVAPQPTVPPPSPRERTSARAEGSLARAPEASPTPAQIAPAASPSPAKAETVAPRPAAAPEGPAAQPARHRLSPPEHPSTARVTSAAAGAGAAASATPPGRHRLSPPELSSAPRPPPEPPATGPVATERSRVASPNGAGAGAAMPAGQASGGPPIPGPSPAEPEALAPGHPGESQARSSAA